MAANLREWFGEEAEGVAIVLGVIGVVVLVGSLVLWLGVMHCAS